MKKLSDRAAYIRGLADGMKLDTTTNEGRLFVEIMKFMEELAHRVDEMGLEAEKLGDYLEDVDADLGRLERVVYECEDDDEDDDCCCCEDEDEDDDCCCCCDNEDGCCECECDADGIIHIQCPNCGKEVTLDPEEIEDEKSPVCKFCGEPFFTDIDEEDLDEDDDAEEDEDEEEGEEAASSEDEDTKCCAVKHKHKKHKK